MKRVTKKRLRAAQAVYQPEIIDYRSLESTAVGKAIVNRRELLKLNQKELAKKVGITPAAMCRIELGQSMPRVTTLTRICAEMQCSLTQLIYPVGARQAANTGASAISRKRA